MEDHLATASVCRAFRAVIEDPRIRALRRVHGFAKRGIVIVGASGGSWSQRRLEIRTAHKSGIMASIAGSSHTYPTSHGTTTDGGTRLFVCTERSGPDSEGAPNQILEVDATSHRWKCVTTLPLEQHKSVQLCVDHCMEWHGGLLYVAGGLPGHNSLQVFNLATAVWAVLPSMPQVCLNGYIAASGVIGNQLFIAGCSQNGVLTTLQIYDIATRTWRLGAPLPPSPIAHLWPHGGIVLDGKLYVIYRVFTLIYDPQFDAWTRESEVPWGSLVQGHVTHTCAHEGRIVVFLSNRTAFQRASVGSWSPCAYESAMGNTMNTSVCGSVLLG